MQSEQLHANQNVPMASLYIGDLHKDATENILLDKFAATGPVLTVRVCRDILTRVSLGYAYVNFQQAADAERALDTMNFDSILGQPIRLMWSQRDPSLRKSGVGNVFIKNLDREIDNKALYDTFSVFGNILSCKIMTDDSGRSKGFGFVHFENQSSANAAIKQVNRMMLKLKQVFVGPFKSKAERLSEQGRSAPRFNNVFIKNFANTLTDESLYEKFKSYGEIISAKVMLDEHQNSKGYGFVSFKDYQSAEVAIENLAGNTVIEGRTIYIGRFQPKTERMAEIRRKLDNRRIEMMHKWQGVNLYVKNLDETIDDVKLKAEFSAFGEITSAKVMMDANRSKGFGFVCFSSPEEATRAVTEMNNRIVGTKPLYVALAQRKEERRQHLQNQIWQRMNNVRLAHGSQGYAPAQQSMIERLPPSYQPIQHNSIPAAVAAHQQAGFNQMELASYASQLAGLHSIPNSMGARHHAIPQQLAAYPYQTPYGHQHNNFQHAPHIMQSQHFNSGNQFWSPNNQAGARFSQAATNSGQRYHQRRDGH